MKHFFNALFFIFIATPAFAETFGLTRLINEVDQVNATLIVASSTSEKKSGADYICDGTADQVQINEALTALSALSNGGKLVLLEGLYSITAPIEIPDIAYGLYTIEGMGAGNTTIYAANGSNCNLIQTNITSGHLTFIILRDFMVQGNRDNNSSGGRGYYDGVGSGQAKDTLMQNMFFYNCHGNCVEFKSGCWGTKVIDSIFEDSDAKGIYYPGGTDIRAEGNKFIHMLGTCIDTNTPASNVIGNIIYAAGANNIGINLGTGANYSFVIDNQIHHDSEVVNFTAIKSDTGYLSLASNSIECTGNTAFAYGISLTSNSTYTSGSNNVINIGGTPYADAGSNNFMQINGAERQKKCYYTTDNYLITPLDNSVFVNSGTPKSVSVPASPYIGQTFHVFNLGSGTVSVMGNGNNINGSASKSVTSLTGIDLTYFYSGNWSAK